MASPALEKITSKIEGLFPSLLSTETPDRQVMPQRTTAPQLPRRTKASTLSEDRSKASKMKEEVSVDPDLVFDSKDIFSLNKGNFRQFIDSRDVAMVLFYKPADLKTTAIKQTYTAAAVYTKRWNHAYASVDCTKEGDLCQAHTSKETPVFAVYTLGRRLGSLRDKDVTASNLKRYMEETPVNLT